MAAGDTGITICSDALIMLGAKAITSFNDGTDESSVCDRLYPDVRDSTLVMYPWTFNTKKIQLAQLLTPPGSVWKYAYQLPGDKLANPRAVYDTPAVGANPRKDWEIQGDQLLTNLPAVFIDYQYSVGEFAMPQYFVQLMKYMMAWHMALSITEQSDRAAYWQRIAVGDPAENGRGGFFRTAMQIDGQHNPVRVIEDYSLVAVRN
ncbi:MAG: hypothetical protein EBT15_06900 [Betaproteobacteria bacterium]|nr:hypothetical protein [Betaproteobacteria bacterium]